jgi:hypothetical protein
MGRGGRRKGGGKKRKRRRTEIGKRGEVGGKGGWREEQEGKCCGRGGNEGRSPEGKKEGKC